MEALVVYSAGTPPPAVCGGRAALCPSSQQPGNRKADDGKENVLPANTPLGGPQLPLFSGGKKGQQPSRRPLSDVTHHYEGSSKGICIGALGSSFGMADPLAPGMPASCRQELAALDAQAASASAAAKARTAAAKRQALRSMR